MDDPLHRGRHQHVVAGTAGRDPARLGQGVSWSDFAINLDETRATLENAPELDEIDVLERSNANLAVAQYAAFGAYPV